MNSHLFQIKSTGSLPPWDTVDVEIDTQDGQRFTSQSFFGQGRCLLLLATSALREKDIAQITLKVHSHEQKE